MKFTPLCAVCCVFLLMPTAPAQTPPATVEEKPGFRLLVPANAVLEKLAGGFRFTEGPAWNPVGGYLVFSDIPASRLYRYDAVGGKAEEFRAPSAQANGNFYDPAGTLYTCEHEGRRVAVQRGGGPLETLVDRFEGKRFSSPNDLVVRSDGTVWFTDPTYGLGERPKEQAANRVYGFDPKAGVLRAVAEGFDQPNGLCFSPDETRLYIADSGEGRHVRVYDVGADGRLANGRVFCAIDKGVPDGMRCDRHGNLFSTSEHSIQVFDPAGARLGLIPVPETPSNLCFGGPDGNELFITAQTSLYRLRLTDTAAPAASKPR